MSEVNWDIAPIDATHHGKVNNPDTIAWYKYETFNDEPSWSFWYSDRGILDSCGWKRIPRTDVPAALPVTPRPGYSAPPIQTKDWVVGNDLPPIGVTCEFAVDYLAENSSLYKQDILQGTNVQIIAHIENWPYDIAAFLYKDENGNKVVRQGIAEAFRPLRTAEEIAKDEAKLKRRKYVDNLLAELGYPQYSEVRDVIKNLYDKGILGE